MRRELITEDELMAKVRKEGLETLEKVAKAYMESDGSISILKKE